MKIQCKINSIVSFSLYRHIRSIFATLLIMYYHEQRNILTRKIPINRNEIKKKNCRQNFQNKRHILFSWIDSFNQLHSTPNHNNNKNCHKHLNDNANSFLLITCLDDVHVSSNSFHFKWTKVKRPCYFYVRSIAATTATTTKQQLFYYQKLESFKMCGASMKIVCDFSYSSEMISTAIRSFVYANQIRKYDPYESV